MLVLTKVTINVTQYNFCSYKSKSVESIARNGCFITLFKLMLLGFVKNILTHQKASLDQATSTIPTFSCQARRPPLCRPPRAGVGFCVALLASSSHYCWWLLDSTKSRRRKTAQLSLVKGLYILMLL